MAGKRFLMAGGGTGGHVMPLLAVADELRRRGHEPFFMGTRSGFEARLVPQRGFPIEYIEVSGFQGAGLAAKLRLLWELPKSIARSRTAIRREGVKACFSLGGYVAAPPVAASIIAGVPVVLMEPNAVPGLVNRLSAKHVRKALLSFEASRRYFPAGVAELSGLPVRDEFFSIEPKQRGPRLSVLVTGGSQGSQTLNRAVREAWPLLAESPSPVRVIHQCGKRDEAALREAFAESGHAGRFEYELSAFLDDMPRAFAEADLIVSRAGAGTVNELMAAGRAAILVPFPFAADDHQTRNAEAFVAQGAGRVVADKDFTGGALAALIDQMTQESSGLAQMSARARTLRKPGAASRAADILEELAA